MRRPHAAQFVFLCVSCQILIEIHRISVPLVSGRWPLSFSVHPRVISARVTHLIRKALPESHRMLTRPLNMLPPLFQNTGHHFAFHFLGPNTSLSYDYLTRGSQKMKTSYAHFITVGDGPHHSKPNLRTGGPARRGELYTPQQTKWVIGSFRPWRVNRGKVLCNKRDKALVCNPKTAGFFHSPYRLLNHLASETKPLN
ncbi:hypothetical protein EDC04DRAFT_680951 [Pisolithus marmoratus]|nr:hypothetical protein EDC04DRAFT_680951 [Pisolithus marmoratus]